MNILEIKNLNLQRSDKVIFRDLNLFVKEGDISLWFGPSGCGKSSLAKLITGQLSDFQGQLLFSGVQVAGAALDRFYVCHENDLFLWQTLNEHIDFITENTKQFATESEIAEFVRVLEIEHLLGRYPRSFSMGETRRAQILRSLILKPKLTIFDETFSALDLKLKNRIMPELQKIWKRQKATVIIITHESEKDFNISVDQARDFST